MPRLLRSLLLLSLLLLGGCSSIDTTVARNAKLAGVQRFFVLANANDSRALDRHLVNALRARGLTAESGPRTMQPDDAQAIVSYHDNWTWDFGDRLVYLQITVREIPTGEPLGSMEFRAKIPGRQTPAETITDLVAQLFTDRK